MIVSSATVNSLFSFFPSLFVESQENYGVDLSHVVIEFLDQYNSFFFSLLTIFLFLCLGKGFPLAGQLFHPGTVVSWLAFEVLANEECVRIASSGRGFHNA